MRIYIASKVTGDENYREKFEKAEAVLASIGCEPINPTCLRLPKSCSWKDYMALTLRMLDLADAVCLLPDWKESPGACIEIGYAAAKGIGIITADQILPQEGASEPAASEYPPPMPKKEDRENEMNEPKKTRICPVCGKAFEPIGRKKYCSVKCRNVEMGRRADPERKRAKKPDPPVKPVPANADPVSRCPKDCRYLGKAGSMKTCDYLLITGLPRECDARPGGCEKYEAK